MKLFGTLYDKVKAWARHPHAERYLGIMSFAESSFFPIPPDVMLLPMVMARPARWFWLATLTTLASVLGGVAGYFIGYFAFETLQTWIIQWGWGESLAWATEQFKIWGVWVVVIAGFSPIPYKVFTVTAGAFSMNLAFFIFASFIGRGARFYIISALLAWLGPRMEPLILRYSEWLGWLVVTAFVVLILIMQV